MKLEIKAIFDSLIIDDVKTVSKVPNNARNIKSFDNCIVFSNNSFYFFKGYGNDGKIYKKEYSYELYKSIDCLI